MRGLFHDIWKYINLFIFKKDEGLSEVEIYEIRDEIDMFMVLMEEMLGGLELIILHFC